MLSTSLRWLFAPCLIAVALGCGSEPEGPRPAASSGDEASTDASEGAGEGEEASRPDVEGAKVGEASGSNAARDAKMKMLKARQAAADDGADDDGDGATGDE